MITTGKAAAKAVTKSSFKKIGAASSKSPNTAIPSTAAMPAVRHGGISAAAAARSTQTKVHTEQIVNITPQFKVSFVQLYFE